MGSFGPSDRPCVKKDTRLCRSGECIRDGKSLTAASVLKQMSADRLGSVGQRAFWGRYWHKT